MIKEIVVKDRDQGKEKGMIGRGIDQTVTDMKFWP